MDQDTFIMRSQELNYRCLQLGQSRAVRPAGQEGTDCGEAVALVVVHCVQGDTLVPDT